MRDRFKSVSHMCLWQMHKHDVSKSVQTYACGKLHKHVSFEDCSDLCLPFNLRFLERSMASLKKSDMSRDALQIGEGNHQSASVHSHPTCKFW